MKSEVVRVHVSSLESKPKQQLNVIAGSKQSSVIGDAKRDKSHEKHAEGSAGDEIVVYVKRIPAAHTFRFHAVAAQV